MWKISGVGRPTFYRLIFQDSNMVSVAAIYIFEIVCCIKKDKENLDKIVEVHSYDRQKCWTTIVCSARHFIKISVVNVIVKL
jgi:hypothetical protein